MTLSATRFMACLAALAIWLATLPANAGASTLAIEVHAEAGWGGETSFAVELRNTGPSAIRFPAQPGWDADGALLMHITSADGKTTTLPVDQGTTDRSLARSAGSTAVTLEAGHAMVSYRSIRLADVFKGEGSYRVVVSYRGRNGIAAASESLAVSFAP